MSIEVIEYVPCDEVHRMLMDSQYDKHAALESYRLHHNTEMALAEDRALHEYQKGFQCGSSGAVAGMIVSAVCGAVVGGCFMTLLLTLTT